MKTEIDIQVEPCSPDLRVLFINGTVLKVKKRDLFFWLIDRTTVALVAIAFAAFLIFYAYFGEPQYLPNENWQIAVLIFACLAAMLVLILSTIYLSFQIVRFQPSFILPIPLMVLIAHVIVQFMSVTFVKYLGIDVPDSTILYERVITVYCLILLFEIIYSVYVLPYTDLYKYNLSVLNADAVGTDLPAKSVAEQPYDDRAHRSKDAAQPNKWETQTTQAKTVNLGGREIKCKNIQMIMAEQNYIRVETVSGSILVRAKMNETVAAIGSAFGVHAHRSCWVSFDMIIGTKRISNGRLALELSSGDIIKVPRARRDLVLSALDRVNHAH